MDSRRCGVCTRLYVGSLQLGVEVCRACAAFFRRAVVNQKQFICRRGKGSCQLDCPRKVQCQKCRLDRCYAVGVKYTETRGKKSVKVEVEDEEGDEAVEVAGRVPTGAAPEESSPSTSNNSSESKVTISPSPPTDPHSVSSLQNILMQYRQCYEERKELEFKMGGPVFNERMIGGNLMTIPTYRRICTVLAAQQPILFRFATTAFPELASFPDQHRSLVLDHFSTYVWLLESVYATYKHCPRLPIDSPDAILLTSAYTYLHVDGIPHALLESKDPDDVQKLTHVITTMLKDMNNTIIQTTHRIKPDDVEFVALMALLLWSPKIQRLFGAFGDRIATSCRSQILESLHHYHKFELKLANHAKRFGDVLLLFSHLQLALKSVSRNIMFMNIFNLYENDSFIYDVFKVTTGA